MHTRAGALFNMLKPFQEFKINLNRIESRPSNKGEYCFEMALDFNGDISNTKVQVHMYTMRTHARARTARIMSD
jgi:prephenate dehydratase